MGISRMGKPACWVISCDIALFHVKVSQEMGGMVFVRHRYTDDRG